MQYNIFPNDYDKEVITDTKIKVNQIKEVNCIEWIKKGSLYGLICGFIIGCMVADKIDSISTGVIIHVIVILVGAFAGWRFGKYQEERIKLIEEDANKKKLEYREEFENEAEKLGMRFLGNPATKKIIKMLWDNLSYKIRNADRRSFNNAVSVSFQFRVFCDRIDRECGDRNAFYFSHNNCEDLKNPLEQAALAWAIAIGLRNEIMQNYSTDPSGTKSALNIKHGSSERAAMIYITYTAPNGYYQEPKPW